jgi:hypothetical protein
LCSLYVHQFSCYFCHLAVQKDDDLVEAIDDDEDDMIGENSDTENTVQAVVPGTGAHRQVRQTPKRTKDCKLLSDFQVEDMADITKAEKYFNLSSVAIVKQREIIQTLRTKIDTLTKDLNNHKVQLCKHLLAAKKQPQVTYPSLAKKAVSVSQSKPQQQYYVMPKVETASSSQASSSAAKFNLANLKKSDPSNNVKVVKVFKSSNQNTAFHIFHVINVFFLNFSFESWLVANSKKIQIRLLNFRLL